MEQDATYKTFTQFESEENWELILNTFTPPICEFKDLIV
jgi:hypothetical protein